MTTAATTSTEPADTAAEPFASEGSSRQVWRALVRVGLLGLPLAIVMAIYVVCDPFKVIWTYDFGNYYDEASPVEINRDYVSLALFKRRQPKEQFDAFIFGSSRSFPLHCDTWAKYHPGIKPFHYPAASENLYGVYLKVKYLDEQKVSLKHAIIEFAAYAIRDVSARRDHMHRLPRELTGESFLDYQGGVLPSYFQQTFFLKYADYKLTGRVRESSRSVLGIYPGMVRIDPSNNDYFFEAEERELATDEEGYYTRRAARFQLVRGTTKPKPCEEPAIGPIQRKYLEAIRDVFRKHGTDYRIELSPLYEQICANRGDIAILHEIFGSANVFDFTGVNEWTEDIHNFYDPGHVRPFVGERILARLYSRSAPETPSP